MLVAAGMATLAGAPDAGADDFDIGAWFDPDVMSTAAETAFRQLVVDPIHDGIEDWIHSDLGQQIDTAINQLSGLYLIGDGAPGTAENPDGGVGGLWFGDGGDGWDATGAGQAGGDGGAALSLFGIGGDGGDAVDGDTLSGLPALGGAGGNGGLLGSHGAVGAFGTLASGPPVVTTGGLDSIDTWITDGDGRVVVLHGLAEVYKVAPFAPSAIGFGDDDAQFLADNGFNVVRLGVIWAGVEPQPGVFDRSYLDSIDETVQTLARHGIHVVLDMHQDGYSSVFGGEGAPEWATQTGGLPNPSLGFPYDYFFNPAQYHAWDALWSNTAAPDGMGLANHYAQMWEYVADYFHGNPNVAGYEIMNEPWGGSFGVGSYFGTGILTPFYNQVDAAIRAVDPSTPVYFEPDLLTTNGLPLTLGTVDDPNSVLSFHDYADSFLPGLGLGAQSASNAVTYGTSHNIPVLLSEFGATNDYSNISDTLRIADQNRIGWTEWEYSDKGDITTTGGGNGWLVADPARPPTGDNLDTEKLAALATPYPQAISGTPSSWSFDSATGTFQLSYSTERADGLGSFGDGSQTTISTPAVEYPNGYQVSVTGGQVVSAPKAAVLTIASDPGADTVSVTVRPAG
ncbi:hypothetical protein AWC24_18615 [Mycolicibacter senuensis]|uniref:Endoglycoceramidase n=1 Tax=Mycolicibacter senuensis TaxID=386913 RepID=A0A7I9XI53_9MYCO|nr:hypothetical protein AWC24_18615 [Mycolicibacter senuensis]GFG69190.1 hypothetical protein MSEN_09100 [Mycolicibacter senuensis]